MKLNIANPVSGSQKVVEIEDEKKVRIFLDKRISEDIVADPLGDEFKGYIFRITGGFDKDGFSMKQGVLLNKRVRLLLDGSTGHFNPLKKGQRKRKSVRGSIVGTDIKVINLVIVKKGEKELPGITDKTIPRRLGPKRAGKIRKLFNLKKTDDVRRYVIRREIKREGKKTYSKAPKIQRLLTPLVKQHQKRLQTLKIRRYLKSKQEQADYAKVMAQLSKEKRKALISKKRSIKEKLSKRIGEKEAAKDTTETKKPEEKKQPTQKKPVQKKAKTTKPAQKKADGVKKPEGQKPAAAKKATAKKPAAEKPTGEKPAGQKPAGAKKGAPKAAPKKGAAPKKASGEPKPAGAKKGTPKAAPKKGGAPKKAAAPKGAGAKKSGPDAKKVAAAPKKSAPKKAAPKKASGEPKPASSPKKAAPKKTAGAKKAAPQKKSDGQKPEAKKVTQQKPPAVKGSPKKSQKKTQEKPKKVAKK